MASHLSPERIQSLVREFAAQVFSDYGQADRCLPRVGPILSSGALGSLQLLQGAVAAACRGSAGESYDVALKQPRLTAGGGLAGANGSGGNCGTVTVESVRCSCPAFARDSRVCKHVLALLQSWLATMAPLPPAPDAAVQAPYAATPVLADAAALPAGPVAASATAAAVPVAAGAAPGTAAAAPPAGVAEAATARPVAASTGGRRALPSSWLKRQQEEPAAPADAQPAGEAAAAGGKRAAAPVAGKKRARQGGATQAGSHAAPVEPNLPQSADATQTGAVAIERAAAQSQHGSRTAGPAATPATAKAGRKRPAAAAAPSKAAVQELEQAQTPAMAQAAVLSFRPPPVASPADRSTCVPSAVMLQLEDADLVGECCRVLSAAAAASDSKRAAAAPAALLAAPAGRPSRYQPVANRSNDVLQPLVVRSSQRLPAEAAAPLPTAAAVNDGREAEALHRTAAAPAAAAGPATAPRAALAAAVPAAWDTAASGAGVNLPAAPHAITPAVSAAPLPGLACVPISLSGTQQPAVPAAVAAALVTVPQQPMRPTGGGALSMILSEMFADDSE